MQEGLRASGQNEYARELAEKYFRAQVEVFAKEKTIKENMAPDRLMGCGVAEFVGWGGLGPVANLIEAVIGLDIDAPANTITWRVTKTERHGLKDFTLGGFNVDLICNERKAADEPCTIEVKSGGIFTLKVACGGQEKEVRVTPGNQRYVVECASK